MLFAMCGLAFSGKSTAACRIAAALDLSLVSLDAIHEARGLNPGEDIDEAHWEETSRIALDRVEEVLRQGRSVVVDDTFSYRFLRDRFRAAAERLQCGFLILFMDTPHDVVAARIEENRRRPTRPHVHPHVVDHIVREFQAPSADEPVIRFTSYDEVDAWCARQKEDRLFALR